MSKESKNERVQSEEGEGRKDRHGKKEGEDRRPGPDGPPLAEWIVAAVGLILVAGTIGFLVYQAIKGETLPPDVVVKVDSIAPVGSGYLVTFRAINQGEMTAEGLVVEGKLMQGEMSIETGETELDYVPSRSEVKGGIFFTRDPRQFELQLQARGYELP